ncbi:MAG: transcriptional regulator [Terriglobia bacterium]
MASGTLYRFGEFRLDPAAGWLRHGEREVELPPKAFQVLGYLIEHRDRLVPKQELIEVLWKDTFVTDDALVQAVTSIRRALGDEAEHPRFIRTKPRAGYQFIAPVDADAAAAVMPATIAPTGRRTARTLVLLIQAGYLGLYTLALFHLEEAAQLLARALNRLPVAATLSLPGIVFLALCGVAVRLYLIACVALDHPQTGRQFQRLFPALFLLDLLWALAPLLLAGKTGLLLALALIPVLAYAPFSQRTLIRSAYTVR